MVFLLLAWIASFALVSAYPEHLACSRIIKVGQPIMGAQFQSGSTASVRLDKVPCGGILNTDTDYVPVLSGIPSNPFLAGEYRDPCILDRNESAPRMLYLIDVTDSNYNPFPGANFTQGVHYWDGTGSLLPPTPCPSRSSGLYYLPLPPYATTTPSVLRFSQPGVVTIRLAWSNGPFYGVNVVENCTYTVSSSCPAPPEEVCCTRLMKTPTATLKVTFATNAALSSITVWNDAPSGPPFYQTDAQLVDLSVSIGSGGTLTGCSVNDALPSSGPVTMPGYVPKVLTCGATGDYAVIQFPSVMSAPMPPTAVAVKVCTKAKMPDVPPDAVLWLQGS